MPKWRAAVRIRRVAMVGAVALLLSAFQLAPLLLDGSNINHSRWEPVWKWDSFGAGQVLKWLFTGELLDYGRLPGAHPAGARRRRRGSCGIGASVARPAPLTPLRYGAQRFWTLLFFGRPFWGPLLAMLGVSADMQLHRVIGGAQIFLVLLAAIGLGALWRELSRRWHYVPPRRWPLCFCSTPWCRSAPAIWRTMPTGAGRIWRLMPAEQPSLDAALADRSKSAADAPIPDWPRPGAAGSRSATCRSTRSSARRTYRPWPFSTTRWRSPRTSWSASTSGTRAITASSISAPWSRRPAPSRWCPLS